MNINLFLKKSIVYLKISLTMSFDWIELNRLYESILQIRNLIWLSLTYKINANIKL